MALTRDQKTAQVKELTDKMVNASSVIFAHYLGLKVSDISKLRKQLREQKADMQVAKKTLIQIAAKQANAPEVTDDMLPGPVACIFSTQEPTAGAAVAFKFGKDHEHVQIIGGIFEGKILSAAEAKVLATIPSRHMLLATFARMINAPLTKFAGAISSPLSGFARVLAELAKNKASETPAPAAETPAIPAAA